MRYDTIVIGGGLSGLTAGALLAKRNHKVAVIDKSYNPGGSCGTFKRNNVIYDQGSSMLYGFGEKGFNSHRFVFNCLEEPIDIIKHDLLYCVNFKDKKIKFWADIDKFVEELSEVFPNEKDGIKRFYKDMSKLYKHIMVDNPSYNTADETTPLNGLKGILKHPISYIRFLSYLNKSTKVLLEKYFKDPEIFKFFDKLLSTYCYANVKEAPAVLAAVMFVDNHIGGSYYPAGSTIFLPGKLEKVIEENKGDMFLEKEVVKIIFADGKPAGVKLKSGEEIFANNIIYSGTVWNLYGKLIDEKQVGKEKIEWTKKQIPTYPSVVLYTCVDKKVIPEDTLPIEMLVGNPDVLDESEVTVYNFSIDDKTLCDEDSNVVIAIGPSFEKWDYSDKKAYALKKQKEVQRVIKVLEKRFPGFEESLKYSEIATPCTIERYTNKNDGAVAGPKQMLGQHMFKRLHTRTEWDNFFCCGESTVMGTGTPTVTTAGISAANAVLKKNGEKIFEYKPNITNYVNMLKIPVNKEDLYSTYGELEKDIMTKASRCQYCEKPSCSGKSDFDIRGIMRRVTVGNFVGAKKIASKILLYEKGNLKIFSDCESRCILVKRNQNAVEIENIINFII